jgi:hypothetical protein
MTPFRTSAGLFVGVGILVAWASCAVYDRSLLVDPDGGTSDAAVDGTEGGCIAAGPPERPTKDDPEVLDGGELTFVVNRFDFASHVDDAGTLRGYDLDRSCTCPGTPSCTSPKPQCDDGAGRDNVGGVQLEKFVSFAPSFNPDTLNARMAKGVYGLLIRIRNWNGAPNDTSVEVSYYVSKGTDLVGDGGAHVPPKFDGTDVFTVAKASLLGGVAPPYIPQPDAVDTAAYVRDGVVVAKGTTYHAELHTSDFGTRPIEVTLTNTTVVARLTKTATGYRLDDGMVAGRWPSNKLLTSLSPVYESLSGSFLCADSGVYQAMKGVICSSVDISSAVQNDNTSATCDALSTAIGFTAVPVTFGAAVAGPPIAQPCGPTWSDVCP